MDDLVRLTEGGRDSVTIYQPILPAEPYLGHRRLRAALDEAMTTAVNRLVGRDAETATRWTRAVAGQDWRSPAGRRQYIPVARLDNDLVVPTHRLGSGSHLIASLHLADGLAVIPADVDQVTAGDRVDVLTTRCWR